MNKLIIFFLLSFFLSHWLAAQCPTDITFTSQSQIDSFPINYPGCTQILGYVGVQENTPGDITNLNGLSAIHYFGKNLYIAGNTALNDLQGLHNVDSIGWQLTINNNSSLTSLSGLDNLRSIGFGSETGALLIQNDSALTTLTGLGNLTSIAGDLYIFETPALTSISSLNNLTFVGEQLVIDNTVLTNISSLNNITHITELFVSNNALLTSLSGLDNVESSMITAMFLYNNPQLVTCDVESVCDYLENGSGITQVYGNANGCDSVSEIEAACQAVPTKEHFNEQFESLVFPTPTSGLIHIDCGEYLKLTYRIRNTMGKFITSEQFDTKTSIDISNLPNGLYFIEVQYGNQSIIKKIVKST